MTVWIVILGGFCFGLGLESARLLVSRKHVLLTEDEYARLWAATWSMGYAVVPSMPVVEDVVRGCLDDINKVLDSSSDRDGRNIPEMIIRCGKSWEVRQGRAFGARRVG